MIDRILVPLDGSDLAAQALSHAALQAYAFQAQILLLRVVEPIPETGTCRAATREAFAVQENAGFYLEGVAESLAGEGLNVDCCTGWGRPAETIIALADEQDVDLIVMSTHGRSGIGRWVYGSVADKVLRGADVPVFLIRASGDARPADGSGYQRILVPLDGSELAELVLPYAEAWAQTFDAEIILLRVPTLPAFAPLSSDASLMLPTLLSEAYDEADAYLANIVRRLKAKGLNVHKAAVEPGAIADTIIDYARDAGADLIVMSTHGRSGLSRWVYGSVADRVLRGADVPILLIRVPPAQRPVTSGQSL